jgi:predicted transcriptional regulator
MVTFAMEVFMNAITVTLSDARLAQLQELATRFQLSPEELVRVSVEELLAQPDEEFQQVVAAVLKKNVELYQRLA